MADGTVAATDTLADTSRFPGGPNPRLVYHPKVADRRVIETHAARRHPSLSKRVQRPGCLTIQEWRKAENSNPKPVRTPSVFEAVSNPVGFTFQSGGELTTRTPYP